MPARMVETGSGGQPICPWRNSTGNTYSGQHRMHSERLFRAFPINQTLVSWGTELIRFQLKTRGLEGYAPWLRLRGFVFGLVWFEEMGVFEDLCKLSSLFDLVLECASSQVVKWSWLACLWYWSRWRWRANRRSQALWSSRWRLTRSRW
jgi:hypothetical protein